MCAPGPAALLHFFALCSGPQRRCFKLGSDKRGWKIGHMSTNDKHCTFSANLFFFVHLMRSVMNLIYEVPLTLTTSNKSLAGSAACINLVFLLEHCDE